MASPTDLSGPTPVHCDGCGSPISPDEPMATLEVSGPVDRDETRPLGDYCERCWEQMAAAIDVIERLLAHDEPGHTRAPLPRRTRNVSRRGRKRRP